MPLEQGARQTGASALAVLYIGSIRGILLAQGEQLMDMHEVKDNNGSIVGILVLIAFIVLIAFMFILWRANNL